MPTAPYAKLRISLDGGAASSGLIVGSTGGNACQLSADPAGLGGVFAYKYEIAEYPPGFATPAGWTLDAPSGVMSYSAGSTPPAFNQLGVSQWGKFKFRLTVNNGDPGENPSIPAGQLVDEVTVMKVPHPSGVEDVAYLEENQFDAQRQWVGPLKTNLRFLAMLASALHGQVRLATAGALAAYTRVGDTITANANGAMAVVDTVAPAVNDRILLKNGAAGADNGIYTVVSLGSAGTPFVLQRALDMATGTTPRCMTLGAVEEGAANGGKQWKLTTVNPITLNTTALTFVVF